MTQNQEADRASLSGGNNKEKVKESLDQTLEIKHPDLSAPAAETTTQQRGTYRPEDIFAQQKPIRYNPITWVLVSWLDPLMWTGYKKPLEIQDLFTMTEADQTKTISKVMEPFWKQLSKHLQSPTEVKRPNLSKALFSQFAFRWIIGGISHAIGVGAQLAVPTFFQQIIYYLQGDPYSQSKLFLSSGVQIAFIIFALQLTNTFFNRSYEQIARTITVNVRTTIIGAVYEKALKISGEASQEFNQGRILNLVNVDAEAVSQLINSSHELWITPAQVIVAIILLHNLLGNAVFAALGAMLASLVVQASLFAFVAGFQKKLLKTSDIRLKSIREVLYAIKVIKLHAWESIFQRRIINLRGEQVAALRNFNIVIIVFVSMAQLTPILMPIVAFIVYSRSTDGFLNPAIIFPALSLFQLLIGPLFVLPSIGSALVQASVSYGRIRSFLVASEADPLKEVPKGEDPSPVAVEIKNATLKWEAVKKTENLTNSKTDEDDSSKEPLTPEQKKEQRAKRKADRKAAKQKKEKDEAPPKEIEPLFKELNLSIPRGKLTCVVGPVGSGKSSFLSAIIGEMTLVNPETAQIEIRGTVAYCPQQAWILTDTVEGNVAFGGRLVDDERMKRALHVAMLDPDLEMLQDGSKTLIGEKGVNLSGGQQARVALARAVYEDADIYLLDDPISALDAHVGAAVFDTCIKQALGPKTRVLVTHQLHVLPQVDHIIVLDNGKIVEEGTFETLMAMEGSKLSVMMKHYKLDVDDEIKDEPDEKKGSESSTEAEEENGKGKKSGGGKEIVAEEERATGALRGKVWLSFFRAAGGFAVVIPILLAAIIQQASQLLTSQWLTWWSSFQFDIPKSQYLEIYGLLGLAQAISMLMLNGLVLYGGYNASLYYHNYALKRMIRSPMSFFDSQPIGRILNRFSKDVESIDQQLWVMYFFVIFSVAGLIGSITIISIYFPPVLGLVIPLTFLYYLILIFYRSSVRELKRLDSNQRSPLYAHISETLAGIPSIRAYKAETLFTNRQRLLTDLSNSPRYLFLCTSIWVSIRIELLASFIILTIGLLGVTKAVAPAQIGLTLSYALGVVDSIGFLLKSVANLESEMNAVERLDYYGQSIPIEAPESFPTDPKETEWPSKGAISIEHLEIRYPSRPDHAVLKNLSLDISPGEKIGVVGRTGSGKSTLLTAVFRLIEANKGVISIDGLDVSKVGLDVLRSRLQIITQEPVLFTGTIRSNLDVEGKYSDPDIWNILEMIGLKDYVSNLPEKLDSAVAENGKNLSVGQRQLICLGRAILYKSKILFLDEATASVDQAADALIQESIRTHFKSATVISIAHRLNTIAGFDRVLVLDDGVMVEFDRPLTLLDKPADDGKTAVFRSLAEATGPANFALLRELALAHERERNAEAKV